MVKKCPHCQKKISVVRFITAYGSDSLTPESESKRGHQKHHVCMHCRQKFWLRYRRDKLQLLFRKYAWVLGAASVAAWWAGKHFLHFGPEQAVGLGAVVLFSLIPIYSIYIKFQTVEFKREE